MRQITPVLALSSLMLVLMTPNYVFPAPPGDPFSKANQTRLINQSEHILGGRRNRVTRWQQEIILTVIGNRDEHTLETISRVFNQLRWLTGIRYRLIPNDYNSIQDYIIALENSPDYDLSSCPSLPEADTQSPCANFVVVISNQQAIHQISRALPLRPVFQQATLSDDLLHCFFSPGISSDRQIKRGFVYINEQLGKTMFDVCAHEEIFQSFGLFNDWSHSDFYSFNNLIAPKIITFFDKTLLATLYHPDFPAGSAIGPVVQHMIKSLQQGSSILPASLKKERFPAD